MSWVQKTVADSALASALTEAVKSIHPGNATYETLLSDPRSLGPVHVMCDLVDGAGSSENLFALSLGDFPAEGERTECTCVCP